MTTATTHQAKVTGVKDVEEMNQVIHIVGLCRCTRMSIDYVACSSAFTIKVLWDRDNSIDVERSHIDEDMGKFDIQVADLGHDIEWSEI